MGRREIETMDRLKRAVLREIHALDWALLRAALTATALAACAAWAR